MNDVLVELFRHKSWATLTLIEFCQSVPDEVLDATTPGTYGTIRDTLRHIVYTEEGYFARLTGKRLADPLPDGSAPLEELAGRIKRLSPHWEELAQDAFVAVRKVTTNFEYRVRVHTKEGVRTYIVDRTFRAVDGTRWVIDYKTSRHEGSAVVMAQVIHHADDHRTHVLSVLSARGVEGPDLDVWSFADASGEAKHVQVPSGETP